MDEEAAHRLVERSNRNGEDEVPATFRFEDPFDTEFWNAVSIRTKDWPKLSLVCIGTSCQLQESCERFNSSVLLADLWKINKVPVVWLQFMQTSYDMPAWIPGISRHCQRPQGVTPYIFRIGVLRLGYEPSAQKIISGIEIDPKK